jgi:hypothetical protein
MLEKDERLLDLGDRTDLGAIFTHHLVTSEGGSSSSTSYSLPSSYQLGKTCNLTSYACLCPVLASKLAAAQ